MSQKAKIILTVEHFATLGVRSVPYAKKAKAEVRRLNKQRILHWS
jgi:hypothetical protein